MSAESSLRGGGGNTAWKIAAERAGAAGFEWAGADLTRLIQRARIALSEVFIGRLTADYGVRPGDPLFAAAMETPQGKHVADNTTEPPPTLRDLVSAFKEARWPELKSAGKAAYELGFRSLSDILGEAVAVNSITRKDARNVFDAVKALPKGYGKSKRWEGLDTKGAIAKADREGLPRIAPATVNKVHMGMIASLFGWARREGWIESNPFEGLRVKDPVAAKDKRDAFTLDQLIELFAAVPWRPREAAPMHHPDRYWFPLIALFQGMRLGEIAQLRTSDFRLEEGVHLFEVRGDLKNVNARRTLPLHPELERLGLLDFVAERRSLKEEYVFGSGPDARGKWGVSLGRWFVRLVESRGLKGKGLGLHALRHSFQDALRRAELHQTALGQALAGRKMGDAVADAYGQGFSPAQLAGAIKQIAFPGLPELAADA